MAEREYLYTLGVKNNSWVILEHINEMLSHAEATVVGAEEQKPQVQEAFKDFHLDYVYLSRSVENRITALIKGSHVSDPQSWFFLIDNKLKDGEIESNIWYCDTVAGLLELASPDVIKYLELKPFDKIHPHLSKKDKKALEGVLPLDFVGLSHEEQVELWKRFINEKSSEETLDLSGFYYLSPRVIIESGVKSNIKMLIMHLNKGLGSSNLSWLYYFPNLTTLSVWYSDMKDEDLDNIWKYAPGLNILEFHECHNLTGRCLIPCSKLPKLDKLILNNERCRLQDNTFETVITDEEWKGLSCPNLTTLYIDSANLTLDFIDFSLKSFKGLSNFIMHELVLAKLEKNSRSGHSEHKITFHSSNNVSEGFYRYTDVKISDLVRNKIGPAFSESMLRKIKELDPSKAELVDLLSN